MEQTLQDRRPGARQANGNAGPVPAFGILQPATDRSAARCVAGEVKRWSRSRGPALSRFFLPIR